MNFQVTSMKTMAGLKRNMVVALMMLSSLTVAAQSGMTDTQVMQFVAREAKAGTSQSQIVTKLMQRGVKIDQIRRVRNQYDKQIRSRNMSAAADAAVGDASNRMRNSASQHQELENGKVNTDTENANDANEDHQLAEQEVMATQGHSASTNGKKVFGRDIFNQRALSFEPNMNIATPQTYVLGPGDQVVIDVYGASQNTHQLTISPEGTVTVPGYGPIYVSGMTVAAANGKIRSTLGSRYASSKVKLSVGQTRTIMINVMGEVRTPGTYTLSAFSTVFHALYRAGGINDIGTLRNVKVYRNGKLITVVDIYEYILNGRLAGNVRLQDGDVVQVGPYDCLVGVTGNVKRPMFYEMRKNESVATLLKYAGGFTGDAYKKAVRLVRQTGERYSVFNVDEFDMSSFKVDDGDAVTVDGMLNRYENMVEVKGAIFRPGQYRLGGEVTSVRGLIERAEGVTEDAFTAHAVLHRMKADRSLEVVSVDVEGIMAGTVPDIPLKNEDVLFIPTQAELRSERTYTITGEVMSPGTYEYADNTSVEDLIMQAGGLTDAASTAKVDVSRRIRDPKATTTTREIAQTFSFALKDGFVVDGNKGFVLQPYDVVHVRRSPGYVTPQNVTIKGEVNFPGVQTMNMKNMRLSDVLAMAGGVTENAYMRGARLVRVKTQEEKERTKDVLTALKRNLSERDSVAMENLDLENTYVVGIELDKAMADKGGEYDIILREGDVITVPEYNATVKVSGDVMFPNTVSFVGDKGYKWYVNKAGGFGLRAKKRKTFVVYTNGTVAQVGHGAKIEPGCEIVVPSKRKREGLNFGQMLSAGTSLASLAAVVASLISITK
mgnify:FL=1